MVVITLGVLFDCLNVIILVGHRDNDNFILVSYHF
jgi:hypothetical protein